MVNPFPNVMEVASKALVSDPTLRFLYRKMPSGIGAAYMFPPKNLILLPIVNVATFTELQKEQYNANLYHELRHHAISSKKQTMRSAEKCEENPTGEGDAFTHRLMGVIEDARIELSPLYVSMGLKQDLTQDRIKEFKRIAEGAMKIKEGQTLPTCLLDRWGYLMLNIVMEMQQYGQLPIHPTMEKYVKAANLILKDGRFEDACQLGRPGNEVSLTLAFEIAEVWQDIRDEEKKEEDENGDNADQSGDDNESANGDNGSQDEDRESGDGEDSSGAGDTAGGTDSDEDSGGDGRDVGDPCDGDDSDDDADFGSIRGDSQGSESSDEGGNGDGDEPSSANDGGTGSPGENEQQKEGGPGESSTEQLRPDSIKDEWGEVQDSPDKYDPEARSKIAAALGPKGKPEDFEGEWWADPSDKDPHGDYLTEAPTSSTGDLTFISKDREIVAKKHEEEYEKIEKQISDQVQHFKNEMTKILRYKSVSRTTRFIKHGKIDTNALHKVGLGHRNIKKITSRGVKMNAAVSLLVDLSGSMQGKKALLATQIAILFGEALKDIPKISYEVRGYNSSPLVNERFVFKGGIIGESDVKKEMVNHWKFKGFNENWNNVKHRMGATAKTVDHKNPENNGATGGCNIDHENLILAAHHLYKRNEERKIMIVLCDGVPNGYGGSYRDLLERELKTTVKKIKNNGIKLFCFGMMTESVNKFYKPDVEVVNSLNDMDIKALKKLSEFLLEK